MLDFVVNEVAKLVPGLPIETIQVGTIYVSELSDQNCLLTLKGQLIDWIGGTRPGNATFVPPDAKRVVTCLGHWASFIHEETPSIPPLLKAGLIHIQFETIHPFLDGNGRLGRLLITLSLCATGVLRQPLLYRTAAADRNRPIGTACRIAP
ncbi:hypothetical protein GOB99_08380 [Sinorhizobium meliloti]|nr:hypothetical protein [Sinorhizobium meliloti]MDX0237203.1 hypothetical protein [Sinorhizobium meliloti]